MKGYDKDGEGGLKPGAPSPSFSAIVSWDTCPIVEPEVLRDWLQQTIQVLEATVTDLDERSQELANEGGPEELQANAIMNNALDFLNVADLAWWTIQDDQPGEVTQAFVEGLRLGLLHERLLALANDRFKAKWKRDEVLEKARAAKGGGRGAADRQKKAEAVLLEVQRTMPNRAITTQKKRAAQRLNVSTRTFNRWLKGSEESGE